MLQKSTLSWIGWASKIRSLRSFEVSPTSNSSGRWSKSQSTRDLRTFTLSIDFCIPEHFPFASPVSSSDFDISPSILHRRSYEESTVSIPCSRFPLCLSGLSGMGGASCQLHAEAFSRSVIENPISFSIVWNPFSTLRNALSTFLSTIYRTHSSLFKDKPFVRQFNLLHTYFGIPF